MGQGVTMMQGPQVQGVDEIEIDIEVELDAQARTDLEIAAILAELDEVHEVHDVQRTDRYRCVPVARRR